MVAGETDDAWRGATRSDVPGYPPREVARVLPHRADGVDIKRGRNKVLAPEQRLGTGTRSWHRNKVLALDKGFAFER
jgi:hypothetical protein